MTYPQFATRNLKCNLSVRMTPKMKDALGVVGDSHGVSHAFMMRTIMMFYLDRPPREVEVFEWRDNRKLKGMSESVVTRLTPEMNERCANLAERMGITKTQLFRTAVSWYLSLHPQTRPQNGANHLDGTVSDTHQGRTHPHRQAAPPPKAR